MNDYTIIFTSDYIIISVKVFRLRHVIARLLVC